MTRVIGLWCRLRGIFYSTTYWAKGGEWSITVDGHQYGEAAYVQSWRDMEDGAKAYVEWEVLTCQRCGHESKGWRRMPEPQ